jgi:hypothetical protein
MRIWPSKNKDRALFLSFLAEQFELNKIYSEKEVNQIINNLHSFNDVALLRRELYMNKYLDRKLDGSKYWKMEREELSVGDK